MGYKCPNCGSFMSFDKGDLCDLCKKKAAEQKCNDQLNGMGCQVCKISNDERNLIGCVIRN